jgi:preprotein translocase subunit SecE
MGNKRGSVAAKGAKRTQEKKSRRFGAGIADFIRGVRNELRRVNWPNSSQLRQSTAVVLIVVMTLGVYVAAWDFVFQRLARLVFL